MDMRLQMPTAQPMNFGPDWNYIQNIQKMQELKKQREEENQYKNALLQISNPKYETVQSEPADYTAITPEEEVANADLAKANGLPAAQTTPAPEPKTQVQQFVPKTYMEFKAAQDYSQTFLKQVSPFITKAVDSSNDSWIKAISAKARNTGLKPLAEYADMLDSVKVKGEGVSEWPVTLTDANIDTLYNKYKPGLDGAGITRDMLSPGKYTATMKNGEVVKFEPIKSATSSAHGQLKKISEKGKAEYGQDPSKSYENTYVFDPNTTVLTFQSGIPLDDKGGFKRRYMFKDDGTVQDSWTGKISRTRTDEKGNVVAENITGEDAAQLRSEYKSLTSSLGQQEKQAGAMGSFVKNIGKQVDRVRDLSKELQNYDYNLLNMPWRSLKNKLVGDPKLAKYEMYLAEIESEIGKLSSGSAASIAELSAGAREKWEAIHNKNLSINKMLELLEETKHAGQMRMESVQEQKIETKKEIRGLGKTTKAQTIPKALRAPTKGAKLTKPIAIEFFKMYGNRADAEKAAIEAGWGF